MNFLREMGVAVEDEGSSVGVSSHVFENEPVADFSAFQVRVLLATNLIEAITGGTKNSGRNTISSSL